MGHQAEVRQTLDIRVATKRVHAATAYTDIAKDQLQHRHGADVLRTLGMLGPAERIHRRHCLGRCRAFRDHLGNLQEFLLRRAADLFDQFRRVRGEMLLQEVPDATGMLKRRVGHGKAVIAHDIIPGGFVVVALFFVIAGKQAILVAETVFHDERGVGERLHVFPLHLAVIDAIFHHTIEEGDVGTLADRRIIIRYGGRTGIARVNDDQLGAAMGLCFRHPFKSTGMRFRRVAAHDDDEVGILDVGPSIRH
ncbi:hypothetical protein D3C80_779500 [compost metagenome]